MWELTSFWLRFMRFYSVFKRKTIGCRTISFLQSFSITINFQRYWYWLLGKYTLKIIYTAAEWSVMLLDWPGQFIIISTKLLLHYIYTQSTNIIFQWKVPNNWQTQTKSIYWTFLIGILLHLIIKPESDKLMLKQNI